MNQCGIYEIVNTKTMGRYIGSSQNMVRRWAGHINLLNKNKHPNRYLQSTWIKHEEDTFRFNVLIYCGIDNLLTYEQLAIDAMVPEYNLCPVAGSLRGLKRSKEFCNAMAERNRGKKLSPESIAKRTVKLTGRIQSHEEREMRSIALKGIPKSAEHRAKLAIARTGTKQSKETIAKRVEKNTGKKRTPEQRLRMSVGIREGKRKSKQIRDAMKAGVQK